MMTSSQLQHQSNGSDKLSNSIEISQTSKASLIDLLGGNCTTPTTEHTTNIQSDKENTSRTARTWQLMRNIVAGVIIIFIAVISGSAGISLGLLVANKFERDMGNKAIDKTPAPAHIISFKDDKPAKYTTNLDLEKNTMSSHKKEKTQTSTKN